ncbi:hypothetical protein NS355_05080 [Sphingomonas yabuuchiae]|uniref:Uncharacterized protein n=1 Tax=Sphingomonas yabuuchiae TaxID=172044 RepID=A0A147IWS0_9SPHN|nr:hypothetical protein NS355_05080 [Sphingomonas yabuuchiae]
MFKFSDRGGRTRPLAERFTEIRAEVAAGQVIDTGVERVRDEAKSVSNTRSDVSDTSVQGLPNCLGCRPHLGHLIDGANTKLPALSRGRQRLVDIRHRGWIDSL